ncbi:MAG: cellulase [Bacteroidetes bacterium]|nr:MAG: cellulase [Bacteroidota bacterium]
MHRRSLCISLILFLSCLRISAAEVIRINQLGYQPRALKVAVLGCTDKSSLHAFSLHEAKSGAEVFRSETIESKGSWGPFVSCFRLDFSGFTSPGRYYIRAGKVESPIFEIGEGVYDHCADFLLEYMRQQRCGYNPYLTDSCHRNDGFIIYHPEHSGERIDVTGGWHDATDYLQYTATSANAVLQMLLDYRENPKAFGDAFQANGLPGPNGIPDVIDEILFGMDWLRKMNPSPTEFYNQIADDRDHNGFRLPQYDDVVYDSVLPGRPVYLASAEKQGLGKYKNRSTGVASTAAKFCSAFALGATVLKDFCSPDFCKDLEKRAIAAYSYALLHPGVSQTAPCTAPYFYEEENWIDDMELAAAALYQLSHNNRYKQEALDFAAREVCSPWIGRDSVRHYQYYPFLNAGHFVLAKQLEGGEHKLLTDYYKQGLEQLYTRGKENPFLIGTPFVWCSNNFIVAALSQCRYYQKLTGDTRYLEMEAALRDWLFGCNPWGTSMIVGLPAEGDHPADPHSALSRLEGYPTNGGLVDGPVYGSIFGSLIGLELYDKDEYAPFQSEHLVYHDDAGDYSTNEPTMDGTACLLYYLSSMEQDACERGHRKTGPVFDASGAIIRGDRNKKQIGLVFTADRYADGAETILNTLDRHRVKASFFLTGNFYARADCGDFIREAKRKGHYLGAHSDKHLLYNNWDAEKTRLVERDSFRNDLLANYEKMKGFGIQKNEAPYFLPPYEWNDAHITQWTRQLELSLINYTPGTLSTADYTTPEMPNYRASEAIFTSIMEEEAKETLNGFILLLHLGTHPKRTDKFYHRLDELLTRLENKGYNFVSLDQLL